MQEDSTKNASGGRKLDHVELCVREDVEAQRKTTLLEQVQFGHCALPEMNLDEIDLSVECCGKQLRAPLLITGMTGGDASVDGINRGLAAVAEELGIAFGVGSQRPLLDNPDLLATYRIREEAPNVLLFGNIGAVQARDLPSARVGELVDAIEADAMCIHLNPAQELTQPEGDRDFSGCIDAIARLVQDLDVPVIAKETGCGMDRRTLSMLQAAGVEWVDVAGAGGTSWVAVETMRRAADDRAVGLQMWDWGVPTAASILYARDAQLRVIGSGGLRSGLDAAKAIALGAELAGMALPWIRAFHSGGASAAAALGADLISVLRQVCCLTGSRNLDELRNAPMLLGPDLERWRSLE